MAAFAADCKKFKKQLILSEKNVTGRGCGFQPFEESEKERNLNLVRRNLSVKLFA